MSKMLYQIEAATALNSVVPVSGYYDSKSAACAARLDREAEGWSGLRVAEWEQLKTGRMRRTGTDTAAMMEFCKRMLLEGVHRFVTDEELQSEYSSRLSQRRKMHVCGPDCADPCSVIQQRLYRRDRRRQGKDLPSAQNAV